MGEKIGRGTEGAETLDIRVDSHAGKAWEAGNGYFPDTQVEGRR